MLADCSTNAIISRNPYYTYAKIAAFFDRPECHGAGIHPTAVIGEDCANSSFCCYWPKLRDR